MRRAHIVVVGLLLSAFALPASDLFAAGKTVAVFELKGQLTEKPGAEDFPFSTTPTESLRSLVERLDKAAEDDKVAAVVVLHEGAGIGFGQLEEIRAAMARVQKAGKPVYAHSDWMMTGGYAFLSGADRFSVTPTGYLIITGIYSEQPYIRGLLDMLGVKPEFLTCGDYKSTAEMFMRNEPSEQAQEMYDWLFDGLYDGVIKQIASGRDVDESKAKSWIDTGLYTAEGAKKDGLIDEVEHRSAFEAYIKEKHGKDVVFDKKFGKKQAQTIDLNSPFGVMQFYMDLLAGPKTRKSTKDAIGIVYVEGGIMPGSPEPSLFGGTEGAYSDPIRKALDDAANDDSIKAVVLRVDSPGGSAVASEVILQATQRLAERKPLIVSMGNVAGSGGYYVSLGSKQVFADPSTITGSIGVVSGKISTTDMWKKVGVNFTPIERGKRAGLIHTGETYSPEDREHVQQWMNEVYAVFKQHVVDIRGDKLKKPIDELAGGRVYTGRQALEFGLIDELGGLDSAIEAAAEEVDLDTYEVRTIPPAKNFLEVLLSDVSGKDEDKNRLSLPGAGQPGGSLWDAALPMLNGLDPQRVKTLHKAFQQLEMLRTETVIMTMPVIDFR